MFCILLITLLLLIAQSFNMDALKVWVNHSKIVLVCNFSDCIQVYYLNVLVEILVTALWITYGMLKKENALVSIPDIYQNNINLGN